MIVLWIFFALLSFLPVSVSLAFNLDRRQLLINAAICSTTISPIFLPPTVSNAETDILAPPDIIPYERRDRKKNKFAVVREDYWYMMGKTPPRRLLEGQLSGDNPQWNAWGACDTSGSENSCTYVPLKQRIPAYGKYSFFITLGAKEYGMIGGALDRQDWDQVQELLLLDSTTTPPACVDALLKMVLFATSMLTTPNYSGPSREMLVARFYVNEAAFAVQEIRAAMKERDLSRAKAAWEFGRDSWNSYLIVVNRQINTKVGDKFDLI